MHVGVFGSRRPILLSRAREPDGADGLPKKQIALFPDYELREFRADFLPGKHYFSIVLISSESIIMSEVIYTNTAVRRPLLSLPAGATRSLNTVSFASSSADNAAAKRKPMGDPQGNLIRAMCFFDGRNLLGSAKIAFGCDQDADPGKLANAICEKQGWRCAGVNYYQGSPDPVRQPVLSSHWGRRRSQLKGSGVSVFDRRVRYLDQEQVLPDGTSQTITTVKEKGVDVRMALDVFELALDNSFDIAVLFCRDQDLSELASSIRRLSLWQDRPIRLASAFPTSEANRLNGIYGTQWLEIDQAMYESCLF
jgi:uncharacterized LabA/DUF88 family protein